MNINEITNDLFVSFTDPIICSNNVINDDFREIICI